MLGVGNLTAATGRGRSFAKGFVPSDVPQAEADELIKLYNNGGGDSWTDNTGWKTDPTVGNWYGITVSGGHVTKIELPSNNGAGDINSFDPSVFGSLTLLYLHANSFIGDLSSWTLPSSLTRLYLYANSFSGDLSSWTLPSSLTHLYLRTNSFSGDLSSWTLPSSLTYLNLRTNSFSGDLSSWTLPSSLTYLNLHANSFSGDLSSWTLPSSLTHLYLHTNSFSGDLSSWTLPSSLTHLYLYNNSFSGDLSSWTLPSSLTWLILYNNSFSGDLSSWTLPSSLTWLYLHANSFIGDLSSWTLPSSVTRLNLYNNSFSGDPGWEAGALGMNNYQYHDNSLSQADVDAVLAGIYSNRADFTDATPELNIAGTNAAPSGTYQYSANPSTGKEYIYALENDDDGEGFNTWSVTYTA